MKARLPKGYGRPDPNAMMRQVQKMQDDIRAKQEELEAKEYTGTASGEMVTVTMNGKHEITAVKIKPEAVDPDDIEMLEDLIAAAVNSASAAARNLPPSISRLRGQSAVSMTGWMSSSAQARRAVVTMSQSFSLPKLYTPPGSSMAWVSRSTASRT